MVFYFSNRITSPSIFNIILKSYIFFMLWHKFHEDVMVQTRKNIIVNTCPECKRKISVENITFYLLKRV